MSSREYWRRREAAQLEKNITEEAAYDAALQKIYSTMIDSIDSDIRSFYSRYATSEGITLAEAKRRADKLDMEEYARKAERYVETKDFSEQANEEMKLYNMTMKVNRLELLKANIGAEMTAGYNDIEKMMGDALTKRTLEEIERQAGILGITINNNAELANSIVNASFHNATWSDRVWANQEELHAKVAQNLTKGLIQGVNSRTLASNLIPLIQDDVKNKRAAAERLMRTELARVQIDAQKRSYIEGGYDEYEIICDFQACHICKPYDGKHYPVAKMEIGENAPPFHPNCRCSTAVYVWDEDDGEYKREKFGMENPDFREESLRTKNGGDYGVNWKTVKSKEYTERFNQLSENEKANALAAQRARNALKNRDGKNTEEIYAINMTTGKDVSSITNQNYTRGIKRTDKFIRDIKRAEANGDKVLLIHNHPSSSVPSLADINELLSHSNVSGITVGHNGNIYYYSRPSSAINESDFRVALLKNKSYNIEKQSEDALRELAKQFNFEFYNL